MENRDGKIHIEDDDARAAVSNTGLRWVLAIGLLLAIIAMTLVWIIPALTNAPQDQYGNVAAEAPEPSAPEQ